MSKKNLLFSTYGVVTILIVLGIVTMLGAFMEPKTHLYVYEFDWEEKHGYLTMIFESKNGLFVTGEEIHVSALLGYEITTDPNVLYFLYLPNTLTPDEYDDLLKKAIGKFKKMKMVDIQ